MTRPVRAATRSQVIPRGLRDVPLTPVPMRANPANARIRTCGHGYVISDNHDGTSAQSLHAHCTVHAVLPHTGRLAAGSTRGPALTRKEVIALRFT
jgi:hypothetical protein